MKIVDILGDEGDVPCGRGELGRAFMAAISPEKTDSTGKKSPFGRSWDEVLKVVPNTATAPSDICIQGAALPPELTTHKTRENA
ncbi:hypothetical protein [Bordetella trematum]|uniref:hypothetical protein n=1 Tax=Bordetella trematum TaxID=123899 RepID=UPI0013FE342A|nr:hypothetical protein [Bordetella trematum]